MMNVGQRKGFLWGVGAAAVGFLLWTSVKTRMEKSEISWPEVLRGGQDDPDFDGPDGQSKDKPEIDFVQ